MKNFNRDRHLRLFVISFCKFKMIIILFLYERKSNQNFTSVEFDA